MEDDRESQSTKLRLENGQSVQLQRVDLAETSRQNVEVIGWSVGDSLIVKPPAVKNWLLILPLDTKYVARLFTGSRAYAFETSILCIHYDPFEYLHLSYPEKVKSARVRQAPRVKIDMEAKLTTGDEKTMAVKVVDISRTGMGLLGPPSLGAVGDRLQLEFEVTLEKKDHSFSEAVIVRNLRPFGKDSAEMIYGMEFATLERSKSLILAGFLYEQMS